MSERACFDIVGMKPWREFNMILVLHSYSHGGLKIGRNYRGASGTPRYICHEDASIGRGTSRDGGDRH